MSSRSKKQSGPAPAPTAADIGRAWAALAEWLVAARASLAHIQDTAREIVATCESDPRSPLQQLLDEHAVNELSRFVADISDADSYLAGVVPAPPPGAMPNPLAALAGAEGGGR